MPEIIIKMDGADAVRQRLKEVAERCGNLSPIMKVIGERVTKQTKDRFRLKRPDLRRDCDSDGPNPAKIILATETT